MAAHCGHVRSAQLLLDAGCKVAPLAMVSNSDPTAFYLIMKFRNGNYQTNIVYVMTSVSLFL